MIRLAFCAFSSLIVVLLSCGCGAEAGGAHNAAPRLAQLPPLEQLDSIKGPAAVTNYTFDVTAPLAQENTMPDTEEGRLYFAAPDTGIAWAIWRMEPGYDIPLSAIASGSGELWLVAADYATGTWEQAVKFNPGDASIDLTAVGDTTSPAGYLYVALVCAQSQSGVLDLLQLLIDSDAYGFYIEVIPEINNRPVGVGLHWNSGIADTYRVYRSVIPNDPAPFLLGIADDSYPAGNIWIDMVTYEGAGDTWVPVEFNTDTPELNDDFYTMAPAVKYYYHIVPYTGTEPMDPSVERSAILDWGELRSQVRELPDTSAQTRVFADQLNASGMNDTQIEWCAKNLAGTQKVTAPDADKFRAYNPDFLVLGYHLATGAGAIGNVFSNTWDDNADWYYVNNHEDWFIHPAGSTELGGRALQTDWNWYAADPQSGWAAYLGAQLCSMMGEDHFDGWFVDSASELWNTSPAQWWPDGETMFSYWTPRLDSMLRLVTQQCGLHPLKPYVIPNAGPYVTTLSDIKYYGTDWACDGIMIEGHARWSAGDYFSEEDWVLQHDRILDHQQHGLATILQSSIFTPDTADRLFVFASYLLVRDAHTYINWLGDDGLDTIDSAAGQWYPEFDIDAEMLPPPAAPAATMATMRQESGLYRRQYGQGYVLVNPTDAAIEYTFPFHLLKLTVEGGGNVTPAGEKQGSYTWQVIDTAETLPPHTGLIILDILD